jgi:Major tropism determinant N-terminal domain
MAVVQISQIKHRRGTSENLPQLASAELGWSVDTQQLYIGNGTLAEGAPEIGNTRILTTKDIPFANSTVISAPALSNNTTANITALVFTSATPAVQINYAIQRGNDFRTGTMEITQYNTGMAYTDNYTETANIGVTLGVTQAASTAQVTYTTTNTGVDANLKYSLNSFTF